MALPCDSIIKSVSELSARHRLSALEPFLASCRAACAQDAISIAVLGRFKAGKSSFLNHLLGRDLLPVGVVPVTAVITEIAYGAREKATVYFLDRRSEEVALSAIRGFIAESENPENAKRVSKLLIELPALERFKNLRFVDTPGMESALAHNTEETKAWLPNVALAVVAVSIDTPLAQHDVELLKSLHRYTPEISLLLTKADLLDDAERAEVVSFIGAQLTRAFDSTPPQIHLYSVRESGEKFKAEIEDKLITRTLAEFHERRSRILLRKLQTLVGECQGYLQLALKAAELQELERDALKRQALLAKEIVDEVKAELRLIVRHAVAGTRGAIARQLEAHHREIEKRLLDELEAEFPQWSRSLNHSLESFEAWLYRSLSREMTEVSDRERAQMLAPLGKVKRQVSRALQNFRDRLSERTMRAYGVPLRTTETEIEVREPRKPDIRVGRVFDRNWELLSPIVPMWLVKPLVKRHFAGKVPYMVEKNLSRLASQWAESMSATIAQVGREAEGRLDELISTVERLTATGGETAPQLRTEIARLKQFASSMDNQ